MSGVLTRNGKRRYTSFWMNFLKCFTKTLQIFIEFLLTRSVNRCSITTQNCLVVERKAPMNKGMQRSIQEAIHKLQPHGFSSLHRRHDVDSNCTSNCDSSLYFRSYILLVNRILYGYERTSRNFCED